MDLFLSILLLVLGFVTAFVAIGGKTWRSSEGPWRKQVTTRGWITILCLVCTVAVGVLREVRGTKASEADKNRIQELKAEVKAGHERLDWIRRQFGDVIDILPKPMTLSPEWSAILRTRISTFSVARLTLARFNCDIKARVRVSTEFSEDDSFLHPRILRGEPKVLTIDRDLPEVRDFFPQEVLEGVPGFSPPPLWSAEVRIELASDVPCSGQYWLDEVNLLQSQ